MNCERELSKLKLRKQPWSRRLTTIKLTSITSRIKMKFSQIRLSAKTYKLKIFKTNKPSCKMMS